MGHDSHADSHQVQLLHHVNIHSESRERQRGRTGWGAWAETWSAGVWVAVGVGSGPEERGVAMMGGLGRARGAFPVRPCSMQRPEKGCFGTGVNKAGVVGWLCNHSE